MVERLHRSFAVTTIKRQLKKQNFPENKFQYFQLLNFALNKFKCYNINLKMQFLYNN